MASNPTFTLFNGKYRIPIYLPEEVQGIRELSVQDGSIFWGGSGAGRWGDGEPLYGYNEQRTWVGGRGNTFFADDTSRFFDSDGWSLTDGLFAPNPQRFFGRGYRPNGAEFALPGNVEYKPIYSQSQYTARMISPGNITADKAYVWLQRVGTPRGSLTFEIQTDSSGEPDGVALKSITVDTSVVTDYLPVLQELDWTSTQALASGTSYWLIVYGDDNDDRDGHWEIACDVTGTGLISADGSTWAAESYSFYYRIVGADIAAHHKFFHLDQQLYAVSIYDTATASRLWMRGARGVATAGASTTLTNSNAAFGTSSEFVGALVKIIRGTGNGQVRTIASHTGTVLTVSTAWDINPDNTSQYIIHGTNRWTEIGSTGLGQVQSVCTYANAGDIAMFGHKNSGDPIRKIRFNPGASPPAHEFADDSTNEGNVLRRGFIAGTGVEIYRAVNAIGSSAVSWAPTVAWGSSHTFGTAISAGNPDFPVTNMVEIIDGSAATSRMFVFKSNEIGFIDNGKWYRLNADIGAFPEATNGIAAVVHGLYVYFNHAYSMERIFGTAIDEINPNADAGLPADRQGYVSCMAAHPAGVVFGIDAGSAGYSSVLFFNGIGIHEIFRSPIKGKRVRDIRWDNNEGGKKYLWVACGDDLMYMEFPRFHQDPTRDSTQNFEPFYYLTTATLDMGNSTIQKIWKSLALITRNMTGAGGKVFIDYQTDADIDTSTWTQVSAGELRKSPRSVATLVIGDTNAVRFRLRSYSSNSMLPVIITGLVVKGAGFTPSLPMINATAQFGGVAEKLGGSDVEALSVMQNNPALVWTVTDSKWEEMTGLKFAVRVNERVPLWAVRGAAELRVAVQLMGLGSDG